MDQIDTAVRVLSRDGLIVYPTETVYGLGADALSEDAVLKVYVVKNRPLSRPISIAVSDMDMLGACVVDEVARPIERFLPRDGDPPAVCLPDHHRRHRSCRHQVAGTWIALAIIAKLDSPITATSANVSGEIADPAGTSISTALPGRRWRTSGTPSTVVDLTTLRPAEGC